MTISVVDKDFIQKCINRKILFGNGDYLVGDLTTFFYYSKEDKEDVVKTRELDNIKLEQESVMF
jgi:hypothetical protein